MNSCELCDSPGGEILWQDERCRIIRVGGAEGEAFPGFCRVVWRAHVREMSDLCGADRLHLQRILVATEAAVRRVVQPDKLNLASLGNVVPHLHWHVVPRWIDDSHYPAPIWSAAARPVSRRSPPTTADLLAALVAELEETP